MFKKKKIKEDRKKTYIIIGIIIVILFLVSCIFFNNLGDSNDTKSYKLSDTEVESNNEKDDVLEEDVEEEKDVVEIPDEEENIFVTDEDREEVKNYCDQEIKINNNMTGYEKLFVDLAEYTYIKSRSNGYKDFSDKEIMLIGLNGLNCTSFSLADEKNEYGRLYYLFKGEEFDKSLKKTFGSNISFDKEKLVGYKNVLDFSVLNGSYINIDSYDKNTDTFKALFGGIGGTGPPQAKVIERKKYSVTENNGEVTIVEKAFYYDYSHESSGVSYKIYSDPEKKNLIDDVFIDHAVINDTTITVDSYLDKAATITHKFRLDSNTGNYYFVNSIIK